MLAARVPPVMIRARARPGRRINDVHGTLAAGDEEPDAVGIDPDADHALAAAREVGNDDVFGAVHPAGEAGAGGLHSVEFPLDAFGDALRYSEGVH